MSKYQTLSEFLLSPFNKGRSLVRDVEYDSKYRKYYNENKIKIFATCIIEDSYYIHFKIPSESQKGYEYDVIIRFFTDSTEIMKESHIRNYHIQFFSNSPSFMYQYAYLYNKEGYLIKALYDKLDPDYIDTPPEKTNADMKLQYDKTIYFACKYLNEFRFRYLDKGSGFFLAKKKTREKFFSQITGFRDIKMDQAILKEEKKLSKLLDDKDPKARKKTNENNHKITPLTKNTKYVHVTHAGGKKGAKPKKFASKILRKK